MNHHGRILLLYGETIPHHLITQSLARILLRDLRQTSDPSPQLYLVDGANAFDAYGLARLITRQGQDPHVILKRIHVSRAFTCYQLAERIATLTPDARLSSWRKGEGGEGSPSPALYLLGLLDTFYDESVPLTEARRLLDQVLAQLRQWRARGALVIIVTKLPPVKTEERVVMVQQIKGYADVDAPLDQAVIKEERAQYGSHTTFLHSTDYRRAGRACQISPRAAQARPTRL